MILFISGALTIVAAEALGVLVAVWRASHHKLTPAERKYADLVEKLMRLT